MSGEGMSGFVTALTASSGGLTSANIWAEITLLAPLIATLTIVAIGIYFVKRVLKRASKGKGGM